MGNSFLNDKRGIMQVPFTRLFLLFCHLLDVANNLFTRKCKVLCVVCNFFDNQCNDIVCTAQCDFKFKLRLLVGILELVQL